MSKFLSFAKTVTTAATRRLSSQAKTLGGFPENGRVIVNELGPRDGLQASGYVPLANKLNFIRQLEEAYRFAPAGSAIEVTSFVNDKLFPQFKDSEELMKELSTDPSYNRSALVLNDKGLAIAIKYKDKLKSIATVISPSEIFCQRNMNTTIEKMQRRVENIANTAASEGLGTKLYLSTAFYEPFEKRKITPEEIIKILEWGSTLPGVYEFVLSDTTGLATPADVKELLGGIPEKYLDKIAVHFHNKGGNALNNSLAAYEMGVRRFDGSVGGIGSGCPAVKEANTSDKASGLPNGNLATEDFASLMHARGIDTGLSVVGLLKGARLIEPFHPITSQTYQQVFPESRLSSTRYSQLAPVACARVGA